MTYLCAYKYIIVSCINKSSSIGILTLKYEQSNWYTDPKIQILFQAQLVHILPLLYCRPSVSGQSTDRSMSFHRNSYVQCKRIDVHNNTLYNVCLPMSYAIIIGIIYSFIIITLLFHSIWQVPPFCKQLLLFTLTRYTLFKRQI